MRFWLSFLLFLGTAALLAQPDSSLLLNPERLNEGNIKIRKPGAPKRKAISATRNLEDVDQLPFTVWVVTAEEIARNGFVTLGDVLRAAPGVRVSQPGNALEGETFMMRGLSGNQYVKVLINDVPVKPTVAPGMPIGAQLPIRQAERIEVFYGPASAIYGDGACAGVINIILKETERPIFTQADLSFGNFGYNNLDLMLGGKLFKDQDIFRFSLYGSSTVRERLDYFYDNKLFVAQNYLPFGLDTSLLGISPNYRPRTQGDSLARFAQIPHESRMLGLDLTWRGIHLNFNRMVRFDHSGLGLSPLAVSYNNPSNRIAEQIDTYAISFKKKRTNRTAHNTFSLIRYQIRPISSFTPIFDQLTSALYYVKTPDIQSVQERQAVLKDLNTRYASDERYMTAQGIDVRFESRINASLGPYWNFDAGIQANLGGGVPPMGYWTDPLEVGIGGETGDPEPPLSFFPFSNGYIDLGAFSQLHWRGRKTTVIGGAGVNYAVAENLVITPRLAIRHRLDSVWQIRANYAEGFRRSPIYGQAHSYRIRYPDTLLLDPGNFNLSTPERVRSAELGLVRYKERFTADILFFYQEARRLARNGYLRNTDTGWRYGFENAPGLAMSMWGIQGTIGDDILDFNLSRDKPEASEIRGNMEFYFQYARGREWFGYGLPATRDVRNFPRWTTSFRWTLTAQKWEFMISSNRHRDMLSSAVVYRDFYQRQNTLTNYQAYRTWDAMLRIYLSKNFLIYGHVKNMFNRQFAGIDATGTQDDLLYNPQPGRQVRFGVNYNMN